MPPQLVTSPIVLMISSFALFALLVALLVQLVGVRQEKKARLERERLKRRI